MSLRYGRKISELTSLTASSAQTYVLGIDNGISYKIAADVFSNGIAQLPSGVLSSSAQITNYGVFATTGSNQFNGDQIITGSLTAGTIYTHQIYPRSNEDLYVTIPTGRSLDIWTDDNGGEIVLNAQGAYIQTNATQHTWLFDKDGLLTVPGNIVGAANLATTGSNTFYGTQAFTGSIYLSGDLIVYGTSSLQNITASVVTIGNNLIYLNTATPTVRYAGIAVYDSGSSQSTGSLLWDSLNNVWVYQNPQGSTYASARLIAGPTSSVLGNEGTLITGRLTVAQADDHISSSQIIDNGVTVTIPGALVVNNGITGQIRATNGIISGSIQLTASFDTRYTLSGSVGAVPAGIVSGSAQITAFGFVSSSTGVPVGTVSGSSQLTASFDARYLVTGSVTASILALNIATASLNSFTSSLNIWTSSVATTGSNTFNGTQTITGSLNITAGNIIASAITANTSSLYLTSGSNLYIQNNGTLEITGSAIFSGSAAFTGSISISSGSITMPNRPAFRVYGTGGPTTAVTTLSGSMTTIDFNQGNVWDNTTGTFTAPIAGLYQVNLVCRTYSNASVAGQIIVLKNNTSGANGTAQIMLEWAANTTVNHMGGSSVTKLAAGDTLRAVVAAGTLSFDENDNLSVAYIG